MTGKSLLFWDRACFDFGFWHEAKNHHGIYFATLAKSNQSLTKVDTHRDLDYTDGHWRQNKKQLSENKLITRI